MEIQFSQLGGNPYKALQFKLLSNIHSTISLKELGILDNPNFKICFLLDSGAMITVLSPKYGLIEVGAVCLCKCCDN